VSEEKKKEAKALSIAILSNMALCHMKLEGVSVHSSTVRPRARARLSVN
jgi:hypothetical protein